DLQDVAPWLGRATIAPANSPNLPWRGGAPSPTSKRYATAWIGDDRLSGGHPAPAWRSRAPRLTATPMHNGSWPAAIGWTRSPGPGVAAPGTVPDVNDDATTRGRWRSARRDRPAPAWRGGAPRTSTIMPHGSGRRDQPSARSSRSG